MSSAQHESPQSISKVLVATGLTPESVGGVLTARWLAREFGAELHAVHVIEPVSPEHEAAIPGLAEKHETQAQEELELFAGSHGLAEEATLHVQRGSPSIEVVSMLTDMHCELLVVGRYGKGGLKQGKLGSIANKLVRQSPVSTLVVPPEFRGEFSRIGVATDLTEAAGLGVERALQLGALLGHEEIVLMHAFTIPVGYHQFCTREEAVEKIHAVSHERAETLLSRVRERVPNAPKVKIVLEEGPAGSHIPAMAQREGVDLLVLNTHTRSKSALLLLGRTTEHILAESTCAVWAEKSPQVYQGFLHALKELLR